MDVSMLAGAQKHQQMLKRLCAVSLGAMGWDLGLGDAPKVLASLGGQRVGGGRNLRKFHGRAFSKEQKIKEVLSVDEQQDHESSLEE